MFRRSVAWSLVAATVAGLLLSAYLLTREEGISVVPMAGVALLAAPALFLLRSKAWRGGELGRRMLRSSARVLPIALVLGVTVATPMLVVKDKNEEVYGVALTNDLSEGAFLDAYAQWQRVDVGPVVFRHPLTPSQRQAVYEISETARLLEPILEDPANEWRIHGCETPPDCDYGGGWLPWALREAAAAVGAYGSATQASNFFGQIATDIDAACTDGTLTCRTKLPASLQSLQRVSVTDLGRGYLRHAGALLTSQDMYFHSAAVKPAPDEWRGEFAAVMPSAPATAAEAEQRQASFDAHRWPYDVLDLAYTVLLPLGFLLGVVLLARTTLTRAGRRSAGPLTALAAILLFAILARLGLVAIVEAAEFAAPVRYIYPAHTLLVAFVVVSVVDGLRLLDRGWLRRRGHTTFRRGPAGPVQADSASSEAESSEREFPTSGAPEHDVPTREVPAGRSPEPVSAFSPDRSPGGREPVERLRPGPCP
ncbi:hypothetical protein [Blastococcus brunescens]|uniref:Uncharacterized protein n=1 Tax=Blastococcus brunescens TaxID=1564165 RepID=A0ABZ1AWH5_9ACTN|nr:hypothetical protein [Blastococcus sp. BMG 8361]WRL62922.1 hypothetical protein U6N30_24115 [Blastococcus sp. BMG 8361]